LWCPYEFENGGGPGREEAIGKPFAGGFAAIGMLSFGLYLIKKPLTARIKKLPETC
jgi:hypothetical protein